MLKKIITIVAMAAVIATTSCKNEEKEKQAQEQAQKIQEQEQLNQASREELAEAVADRDELLSLVNEIQQGLVEVKSLESVVTVNTSESPDRRTIIRNDIAAIQTALNDRKARLAELEKKLAASNLYSEELKKTIATLNKQIEEQAAEITRLNNELTHTKTQLSDANTRITKLDSKVDSLNTTVANVTSERNTAEAHAASLTTQLNTGFYVLGSKKELKEHNILQGRKDVLQGQFDKSYFTAVDKTKLTTINTYSKKCKVLTKQPKDSYRIDEGANKIKTIVITNPERFWMASNYLVVQTD